MRRWLIAGVSLVVVALLTVAALGRSHAEPLPEGTRADRVVVEKGRRVLSIYSGDEVLREYEIALGDAPEGHKQQEGDERRAAERGVSPGGDIFIHGLPPAFAWVGAMHVRSDWTNGCIAVTNEEIEELWRVVPNGTPIDILP